MSDLKAENERLKLLLFVAMESHGLPFSGEHDPLVILTAEAHKHGRRLERAAIVADLRKMNQAIYPSARFLADRYERGEHEKEGKR